MKHVRHGRTGHDPPYRGGRVFLAGTKRRSPLADGALALRCALLIVLALLPGAHASAHPLGNYSINQYTLIDLRGQTPRLYYLLDIAEIPSLKEMDHLDANYDNEFTGEEVLAYLDWRVPDTARNLDLTLDGAPVALRLLSQRVEIFDGVGGMPVVNLYIELEPDHWTWPDSDKPFVLEFRSRNHEAAQGFRESYTLMDGRFRAFTGPWPQDKELKYLTLVLEDEKKNPLFQSFYNRLRLELAPGGPVPPENVPAAPDFSWTATARAAGDQMKLLTKGAKTFDGGMLLAAAPATTAAPVAEAPQISQTAAAASPAPADAKPIRPDKPAPPGGSNRFNKTVDGLTNRVNSIIENDALTPPLVALALLIAALMGAVHAFTPGHGKTVMAAYLIGERGTTLHALVLGLVVTVTHVWSILALGVISLYATEHISETQFTFWTGVVSGGIIVLLGLFLFRQRYAQYLLARFGGADEAHHHHHGMMQDHAHDDMDLSTDLPHEHGLFASHTHVIEGRDGKPPAYRSILWLGVSGGIVPCPAALIVLLAAIHIGRLPLGLLLILAFSVGLAAVLVLVGITVVRASGAVRRRFGTRSRVLLLLPVASSVLITLLGLFLVTQTLLQFNVIIIPNR